MTKILIAEDERDIRDLIVFTLQFGGYEVVATTNGAEAVELAPSEKPDLIMLDVRMPKMTGYEACVALKANPDTKEIPVMFLSAKGQESEVSTGLEAGAVAYILKPFAPDQLIGKVKEALSIKKVAPAPEAPAASPATTPETKSEEKEKATKETKEKKEEKKEKDAPKASRSDAAPDAKTEKKQKEPKKDKE
jgi:CheY-like chemotaxis protein